MKYLPEHLQKEQDKLFYEYMDTIDDDDECDPWTYMMEHGSKELIEYQIEYEKELEELRKDGTIVR